MEKMFKLIFISLALIALFVSCDKDKGDNGDDVTK